MPAARADDGADTAVLIEPSPPLPNSRGGLGTALDMPLEREVGFRKKVTEREIDGLWAAVVLPKPANLSDEAWQKIQEQESQAAQARQRGIPADKYELAGQVGEYVGWFGIVRGVSYDAAAGSTTLLLEHKYFDGLTDLHMHIVSLYGAGDFRAVLPGKVSEDAIPPLSLVCVYGKVSLGADQQPQVAAEYVRVWDWGRFTLMDYGPDKSNPQWIKLRKVARDNVYSPRPDTAFYEQRLGSRTSN